LFLLGGEKTSDAAGGVSPIRAFESAGDIVDAGADRVRREAPCFSNIAAAETSAVGDRAYRGAGSILR
jgi:hypothetical protein